MTRQPTPSSGASAAGARQRAHYEDIHDDYEAHYYDAHAMAYRERYIYAPLADQLGPGRLRVADLASGSGHNSLALRRRFPDIELTGFDISPSACEAYQRNVGRPSVALDLTQPAALSREFDCAILIGGLHHCVADLPQTIANIAALLKPGGSLFMLEPSSDYFLQAARDFWYRRDRYFDAETEQALNHDDILATGSRHFEAVSVRYFGGPAYFLVLNSLVFRLPHAIKAGIAAPLMLAERVYNALPGRLWYPAFLAHWRRRP